jgi:hypothetical protein
MKPAARGLFKSYFHPFLLKLVTWYSRLVGSDVRHPRCFASRTIHAQGICYGSRRHDAARCLMLFGQRLPSRRFNMLETELLATGELRRNIVNLMRRLDLNLI